METNVLDKAAEIAKASLEKIEEPAKAKAAEAEAKGAAEKLKADEAKKTEGIELAKKAEAKVKEDERILGEDDTKLSEPEKKRKVELLDIKRKKDDTPEAKIARTQAESQKRIDEIKSELLAKENKSAQEMAALRAEIEELKKPKAQEDAQTKSKREESERIAKYVDEDKSKPKEDRREMSKEELDGWYLEDPVEATAWINKREIRRDRELQKAREEAAKPDPEKAKKLADDFIAKQTESRAKLIAKYPGVMPSKEKIAEFKAKAKDQTELNEMLSKDNPEFKLCVDIVAEDSKKYLESTNGPELVMAEMEKRLAGKPAGNRKIELTQEELDAKVQAEIERRKLVDGEGISSSTGGKKVETQKDKSDLRQKQEQIAKKAGMTVEQLDARIKRRETIPGASSGGAEE